MQYTRGYFCLRLVIKNARALQHLSAQWEKLKRAGESKSDFRATAPFCGDGYACDPRSTRKSSAQSVAAHSRSALFLLSFLLFVRWGRKDTDRTVLALWSNAAPGNQRIPTLNSNGVGDYERGAVHQNHTAEAATKPNGHSEAWIQFGCSSVHGFPQNQGVSSLILIPLHLASVPVPDGYVRVCMLNCTGTVELCLLCKD